MRSALDPVAFAESLGVTPDPWQATLLRSEADRVLLNCSRQSGKTSMSAILALHRALFFPDSLVLCLAPALRQSQELFSKIAGFYSKLGEKVPAGFATERKLGMQLTNGSRIEALPGSEKTIRGFSGVDLLLVDEAARVDDALYYSVRPMLAVSGGRLVMMSTPYGKRGVFFEEWTNGVGWERYEVPATDCLRISAEFLEQERRSMPEWWFEQEYMCEFKEAVDSVFSSELIRAAMDDSVEPLFGIGA